MAAEFTLNSIKVPEMGELIAELEAGLPKLLQAKSQQDFMAATDEMLGQFMEQDADPVFTPDAPADLAAISSVIGSHTSMSETAVSKKKAGAKKAKKDAEAARNKFKATAPTIKLGSRFGGFRR